MTVHSAGLRPLGQTGLEVTGVCLGTSPLASMPQLYGYQVGADQAEATVAAALTGPFNFIDTSNNYGGGAGRAAHRRRPGRAGRPARRGACWRPRPTPTRRPATSPARGYAARWPRAWAGWAWPASRSCTCTTPSTT